MIEKPQYIIFTGIKSIIIFFFFISFLLCQNIQSQFTWQRILNNSFGNASIVLQCNDSGFAVFGSIRINNEYKINLTKLDKSGNILWVKIIGIGYAHVRWAEQTNENGFIIGGYSDSAVGGSKVYIVNTDHNGDILWQRYYVRSDLDQCNCIKQTNDNGFIIGARTQIGIINSIWIFKIDKLGNLEWEKVFNTLPGHSHISEVVLVNNGYLICGTAQINTYDVYLLRISLNGDTLWSKTYGGTGLDAANEIEKISDYGFLIAGYSDSYSSHTQSYLLKTDTSGNIIWQRTYGNLYSESCSSLRNSTGNRYILAGASDTAINQHTRAFIKITDTNGIVSKQATFFPGDEGGWFNSVDIAFDRGLILCGTAMINTANKMYAVKTDSLLYAEPIGIQIISGSTPDNFNLYQNYPNPFNPTTKFKFDIPVSSQVTIKIYDILGKQLFSINEFKNAGSYEVSFDGSDLASGMYFYSLESSDPSTGSGRGFKDTKKMVLIK